jgi:hypothetical protein
MEKLPGKYQKALDLIISGALSYKDIATQCGFSADYLYQLVEGKEANRTKNGKLFYESLQKYEKQRDKEIKDIIKSNKKQCHMLINEYLGQVAKKKGRIQHIGALTGVANALSKSTPNVEIGSFSYTKGLSAEDITNEWKRLQGIGRGSANRSRISGLTPGGAGESPMAEGAGDTAPEESEDTILPAEREAGPLPSGEEPN